jgi:hypothetical protein
LSAKLSHQDSGKRGSCDDGGKKGDFFQTKNNFWSRGDQTGGLPDFPWYNTPKREKITKWLQNIPNGHKIYQMATKYTKWPQNIPKREKYTKWPQNIPNGTQNMPKGRKMDQMAIKYTSQHTSMTRPSKIYPNWDFWFENNTIWQPWRPMKGFP